MSNMKALAQILYLNILHTIFSNFVFKGTYIEIKYVFEHIHLVAQCSNITNTVLFLKHLLHHFFHFLLLSTSNVRMSEGTFCPIEVHIYNV